MSVAVGGLSYASSAYTHAGTQLVVFLVEKGVRLCRALPGSSRISSKPANGIRG